MTKAIFRSTRGKHVYISKKQSHKDDRRKAKKSAASNYFN